MKRKLTNKEKQQLTSLLEHMLRNDPAHYGLDVDEFGAAALQDVALAAAREIPWVLKEHIVGIAGEPHSDLMIEEELIQYYSGHLYPVVHPQPVTPPRTLYLATNPMLVNTWLRNGAEPLLRRYLLLFASEDEAWHHATAVESVHSPTVFTVAALKASQSGTQFFVCDRTYYCKKIAAQFLKL
jgi:RNA:NAD 2'-phosphotransferase (TPT1/KptA family)